MSGNLLESLVEVLQVVLLFFAVDAPQELVVLLVSVELEGVLVVGEQSVVSVGQISQGSSL